MFRIVKRSKIDSKEVDDKTDVKEKIMTSCVSVRRKEAKSGMIIWKRS